MGGLNDLFIRGIFLTEAEVIPDRSGKEKGIVETLGVDGLEKSKDFNVPWPLLPKGLENAGLLNALAGYPEKGILETNGAKFTHSNTRFDAEKNPVEYDAFWLMKEFVFKSLVDHGKQEFGETIVLKLDNTTIQPGETISYTVDDSTQQNGK